MNSQIWHHANNTQMSHIKQLLNSISKLESCKYNNPSTLPLIDKHHSLPNDVAEFYQLCSGLSLWTESDYEIQFLPPEEVKLANPIIIGQLCPEDISANWYAIARIHGGEYITIDFSEHRLGRCYDSFHTRHGIVGDCPIIAKSFTSLLENCYNNRGDYWYWLRPSFTPIGDAYDDA